MLLKVIVKNVMPKHNSLFFTSQIKILSQKGKYFEKNS